MTRGGRQGEVALTRVEEVERETVGKVAVVFGTEVLG